MWTFLSSLANQRLPCRHSSISHARGSRWFPIGRPRCILRTPVVHILNGTITGVVSTQHTVYTLIGTDSAHRGMNILCRLSIGLPTWHNVLRYTHTHTRARAIMRRESFARIYVPSMHARPWDRTSHITYAYTCNTYVAHHAYARKLLLCVCSPTAKWLIIAYSSK